MTSAPAEQAQAPRARTGRRVYLAVLLLVDLAVMIPACIDGGGDLSGDILGPLMITTLLCILPVLVWHRWYVFYFFANAVLLTGLFMYVWHFRSIEKVVVDNFSGSPVRIECDGQPWLTLKNRETRNERLRLGTHDLVVFDAESNRELERLATPMEPRPFLGFAKPYILNVNGGMAYIIATYDYSTMNIPRYTDPNEKPKEPEEITEHWFRPKVDKFFEEAPSSVKIYTQQNMPGFSTLNILRRSPRRMRLMAQGDMRAMAAALKRWIAATRPDLAKWKAEHPRPLLATRIDIEALTGVEVPAERVRAMLVPNYLADLPLTPWKQPYRFFLNEKGAEGGREFVFGIASPFQYEQDLDAFDAWAPFVPSDAMLWMDDEFFVPLPDKNEAAIKNEDQPEKETPHPTPPK